jgi:hypothetical protein
MGCAYVSCLSICRSQPVMTIYLHLIKIMLEIPKPLFQPKASEEIAIWIALKIRNNIINMITKQFLIN